MLNLIDTAYFKYTNRRTGIELLNLLQDPANPILSYIFSHLHFLIIGLLCIFFLIKLYPSSTYLRRLSAKRMIVQSLILIPILLIGMRGGLGLKPVKSIDASKWVESGLESWVLNTPFQIISSFDSGKEPFPLEGRVAFHVADSSFMRHYPTPEGVLGRPKNIVLIIVESLGKDYFGFLTQPENDISLTPFLDSLAEHSLVFPHFFANGTRSIDALPALYAGIPDWLSRPFIYSTFQANTIFGSHYYLQKLGYKSYFYHGAARGTMGFESFLNKVGPIEYSGLEDYPNKKEHYDGKWGIFDHYYLPYVARELHTHKEPYFAGIFTLSSHHPYKIPEAVDNAFSQTKLPIHRSVQYADFALRELFNSLQESPHFNNSIFVITGDHTSHSGREYYYTDKGKHALFCMIFDPSNPQNRGLNYKNGQQIDIPATVLHLAGYGDPFFSLGVSLLDSTKTQPAVIRSQGSFVGILNNHVLKYQTATHESEMYFKPNPYEHWPDSTVWDPYLEVSIKKDLKSMLKVFWKKMEENRFF